MATLHDQANELEYRAYQDRQYSEISRPGLEARLPQLGIGGRARFVDGRWIPLPYRGFAMQAMVAESDRNGALQIQLQGLQRDLLQLVPRPGVLYPLPSASFHQTVANTFSADRLVEHVTSRGLYEAFPDLIAQRIQSMGTPEEDAPLAMRLIGISLFRTAIGILGAFDREEDFNRVIAFRDRFYADPELAAIGLRRTRPFIGHLTLAYVEDSLAPSEKRHLLEGIDALNQSIRAAPFRFDMPRARLHRYEDLSAFVTESGYPSANL